MRPLRCAFEIISRTTDTLELDDIGSGLCLSVTNDAEAVVAHLLGTGELKPGMRLFYLDSDDNRDEILINEGRFAGFTLHNEASPSLSTEGANPE